MPRYSAHEHTARLRTRPAPLSDLDKGILARMTALVLDGETRYFNYTTLTREGDHVRPVGNRLDIRIITKRGVNAGRPTVEVAGAREITLVEKPQENRLRILWGMSGWWVEVALTPFHRLVELAGKRYGSPVPPLTTVAVRAELVGVEA